MFFQRWWLAAGISIVAVAFAYYASSHPMDFRVYHYGARGVFDGTRPVYGTASGLGWPLHYRYPPLFLLLFSPFSVLPLKWGAAAWLLLKAAVLVVLWRAMRKRMPQSESWSAWPTFLFIAPYIVEEFRYGNAQFFVIALTIASLLMARERPSLSAASLALAISMKVWPLFFVPYLAVRKEWKVVSHTLAFTLVLTLLPSLYFGFQGNIDLLRQWASQESQIQLGSGEIWFPNQSLRGVMMRYLTVIDYSEVPDGNYPPVNVVELDPRVVRLSWFVLGAAAYVVLMVIAYQRRKSEGWLEHGLAFCMLAVLQPFTQKYALALLLWPALVAGFLFVKPTLRLFICIATILVLIQPLTPGATAQRFLQALGLDFWAAFFLTATMFAALRYPMVETRSGRIP